MTALSHDVARSLDAELRALGERAELRPALRGWWEAATAYAEVRTRWSLMTVSERADQDARRTALHNVAIDALNRLSREARSHGLSNEWRATLGDDRKLIGDLACWCALFRGIESR